MASHGDTFVQAPHLPAEGTYALKRRVIETSRPDGSKIEKVTDTVFHVSHVFGGPGPLAPVNSPLAWSPTPHSVHDGSPMPVPPTDGSYVFEKRVRTTVGPDGSVRTETTQLAYPVRLAYCGPGQ